MKKILIAYEKDGEITKEDIEGFLNEMGSFPSDEEIIQKIEVVDHDGMIKPFFLSSTVAD